MPFGNPVGRDVGARALAHAVAEVDRQSELIVAEGQPDVLDLGLEGHTAPGVARNQPGRLLREGGARAGQPATEEMTDLEMDGDMPTAEGMVGS